MSPCKTLLALLLTAAATLSACAGEPDVSGLIAASGSSAPPQIEGAHGPLTARQSKAVLARLERDAKGSDVLDRHLALEGALAERPLVAGNKVTSLADGATTLRAMFDTIKRARNHLNLEYYIIEDVSVDGERLSDLLIAQRQRGVDINIIYDSIGSLSTPAEFFERLRNAGVKLVEFHPVNPLEAGGDYSLNDRDHRKLLIADGDLAVIGGVNLSTVYSSHSSSGAATEPHTGPWRDNDLEIEGPAVAQLQKLFLLAWSQHSGGPFSTASEFFPEIEPHGREVVRIVASGPDSAIPEYYVSLLSAIRNAESRIWVTAAYFIPTHQERKDLRAAARRGADVRLLLPGRSDSELAISAGRSYYEDLLEAGVKIYEYRDSILHSKSVTIDGVWSVMGSSNFDHRSVLFNDEIDAVVLGRDTAAQIEALFREQLGEASAIDRGSWERRPIAERLRELFARVWQVLL